MNELSQPAEIRDPGREPAGTPLDSQLAELIEVVWACEVAGRREDRIDAAIKYGRF
jgi:hypothetical protein